MSKQQHSSSIPSFSLRGSFLWQINIFSLPLRVTSMCDSWKIQFKTLITCQRPWLEMSNGHWKDTVRADWAFPDHPAWDLFTLNWVHNGANKPITVQRKPLETTVQLMCYSLGREIPLSNTSTTLQRHSAFSSREVFVLDSSAFVSLNSFTVLSLNPGPKFSYSSRHQQQIEWNPPNRSHLKHALRWVFFRADILLHRIIPENTKSSAQEHVLPSSSAGCRDQHQLLGQLILFYFLSFYYVRTESYPKSNHWQGDEAQWMCAKQTHVVLKPRPSVESLLVSRSWSTAPASCSPAEMTLRNNISSSTQVLKLSSDLGRRLFFFPLPFLL